MSTPLLHVLDSALQKEVPRFLDGSMGVLEDEGELCAGIAIRYGGHTGNMAIDGFCL